MGDPMAARKSLRRQGRTVEPCDFYHLSTGEVCRERAESRSGVVVYLLLCQPLVSRDVCRLGSRLTLVAALVCARAAVP